MQQKHRDREHDQGQTEEARDVLHDRELHPPDDEPNGEGRHGHPECRFDARRELQRQGYTADLRRQRQEVDQERGAEIGQGHASAEAFSDDLEGRPPTGGGDPSGHLGEDADPDDPDDDDPHQGQTESGAHDAVDDQIPDVEKPPDRGEHTEGDGENPLHSLLTFSDVESSSLAIDSRRNRSGSSERPSPLPSDRSACTDNRMS